MIALARASFHADYATTAEVLEGTREVAAKLEGVRRELLLGKARYTLAVEGGRVVAAVGVRTLADGRRYVDDLFVHPLARRRGVARALLQAALPEGSEVGCEVNRRNAAALAFFEGLGFRRVVETVVLARPPATGPGTRA